MPKDPVIDHYHNFQHPKQATAVKQPKKIEFARKQATSVASCAKNSADQTPALIFIDPAASCMNTNIFPSLRQSHKGIKHSNHRSIPSTVLPMLNDQLNQLKDQGTLKKRQGSGENPYFDYEGKVVEIPKQKIDIHEQRSSVKVRV